MATLAHRAQMANENSRQQKNEVVKGVMGKGKPGTGAPRGPGRRALSEVGNLVETATAATAGGLKNIPASKPGVVTRMAARRAAQAAQAGTTKPQGPTADAANEAKAKTSLAPCNAQQISSNNLLMGGDHYSVAVDVCCAAVAAAVTAVHPPARLQSQQVHAEEDDDDDVDFDDSEDDDDDVVEVVAPQQQQPKELAGWDHGRADKAASTSALLMVYSEEASGATAMVTSETKSRAPDIDIDWEDKGNPLAEIQYVEDIYAFYRKTEKDGMVPQDYMTRQSDINENMRAILLDWLIEVHLKFKLMPETMYLTSNLIDRYLAVTPVTRRNLQLVGITAMLVASKYEEIWAPEVKDFVYISDNAYTRDQILQLEKHMLNTLRFNLTVPTPYVFATRFIKAAAAARGGSPTANAEADKQTFTLVWYLLELCLPEYCMVQYSPSMLAASAVYAALVSSAAAKQSGASSPREASFTSLTLASASTEGSCVTGEASGLRSEACGPSAWVPLLVQHTGYSVQDLVPCASLMVGLHQKAGAGNLKAVHKKYSSPKFGAVAKMIPACSPSAVMLAPMDTEMASCSTASSANLLC